MEPLKLLLDQGIPADAAPLFRELGYPCHHVSEFGMQRAEDDQILARAAKDGFIVLTLDADFHALVAVQGLTGPSVIRLRKEGCRAAQVVLLIKEILAENRLQLTSGCLVSVTDRRATFRMLPIGGRF